MVRRGAGRGGPKASEIRWSPNQFFFVSVVEQ